MENYNEIPKTGTIGRMVDNINTNFQLTKEMLERIQLSKDNSRGLFTTAAALQAAYPSPEVGDWAFVGSTSPFDIYICSTAGTWADSGNDYNGGEVNLSEYAKKASVDSLASTVSSEASRLRTDEAWLQRVDNDNMANGRQITTLGSQLTDMKTVDDRQDSDIEGIKEDLRNLNPVVVEGNVTNNPDNVFLTSANDEITPKERTTSLSAKGHYIMRPTDNFAAKLKANYIHEIPFDVDLGGASVTIPANAVLKFTGGKISGGTLVLQNTYLDGDVKLSADVAVSGTCANLTAKQSWFADNDVDAWISFINNVDTRIYSFEQGIYSPSTYIDKAMSGSAIRIEGNGVVLRYSAINTATPYISISPMTPVKQIITLPSNIASGDGGFDVPDGSAFKRGDIVALRDYAMSSFNYHRNYQQGEIVKVAYVNGNRVVPMAFFVGNYTHASSGDVKAIINNFVYAAVHDLHIEIDGDVPATENTRGIVLTNCVADLSGCSVRNFRYGIRMMQNIDSQIRNCTVLSNRNIQNGVDNYGLEMYGCQNVNVYGGDYRAGNHGITISGAYTGESCTVSRFIRLHGLYTVGYRSSIGINSHGAAECLDVENCDTDGIALGCNKINIINNRVTGNISSFELMTLNLNITGNVVGGDISISTRTNVGAYECSYTNYTPNTGKELLTIADNNVVGGIIVRGDTNIGGITTNLVNVTANITRNVIGYLLCVLFPNGWETYTNFDNLVESAGQCNIMGNSYSVQGGSTSTSAIAARLINFVGNTLVFPSTAKYHEFRASQCRIKDNYMSFSGEPNLSNGFLRVDKCDHVVVEGNVLTSTGNPMVGGANTERTKVGLMIVRNNITVGATTSYIYYPNGTTYTFNIVHIGNKEASQPMYLNCGVTYQPTPFDIDHSRSSFDVAGSVQSSGGYIVASARGQEIALPFVIGNDFFTTVSSGGSRIISVSYENVTGYRTFVLECVMARVDGNGFVMFDVYVNNNNVVVIPIRTSYRISSIPNVEYNINADTKVVSLKIYDSASYNCLLGIREVGKNDAIGRLKIERGTAAASYTAASVMYGSEIPTTAGKPSGSNRITGQQMFDTNTGKPIWWNGSAWVDATGTNV